MYLGGQFVNVTSSDNADNLLNSGIVYRWEGSIPANAPKSYAALITYKTGTNGCVQICFSRTNPQTTYKRVRYDDSTWSEWRVFYDSGLLSNSELLSPLASALGVNIYQRVGSGFDFNNAQDRGFSIYEVGQTTEILNAPAGWGVILVFRATGNQIIQLYLGAGGMFFRYKDGSNDWYQWKQIQTES